jgi:hypothetical protein
MRQDQELRNQNPVMIIRTSDDEGRPLIAKSNEIVKIEGFLMLIVDQEVLSKLNQNFYAKSFLAGLTISFFISFAILTGLSGEPYMNYNR